MQGVVHTLFRGRVVVMSSVLDYLYHVTKHREPLRDAVPRGTDGAPDVLRTSSGPGRLATRTLTERPGRDLGHSY